MPVINLGLGVKLNVVLVAVLGILLISTILLLNINTLSLTEEIGLERIKQEVSITERQIANIKHDLELDIDFLASNVLFFQAIGRRSSEDVSEIVVKANESLGLDDIDVVDGDGKRLIDLAGDSNSQEDAVLATALGGAHTSGFIAEEHDGRLQVTVIATGPVVSITGNILGAVLFSRTIDTGFLSDLAFNRAGMQIGLIYGDRLITQSSPSDSLLLIDHLSNHQHLTFPQTIQDTQHHPTLETGIFSTPTGSPYALSYVTLAADQNVEPVILMVMVELNQIAAFQNTTLANTISIFLILTLLSVVALYFTINRIAIRPINNLTTLAKKMTGGDYAQQIPASANDEIGRLAEGFNSMASAIQYRETSLQAARIEAEKANAVKSTFLASMSHELRTPLNAIINFTKFVVQGDLGPVNEQQEEILQEVVGSGKHLLNLINDVLDMSKIEAGTLSLFIEDDVSLGGILDTVMTTGKSLLVDKSVTLKQDIAPDLPHIRADRQRVLQILLNVMSNACKFTAQGWIELRAHQAGDDILIAVQDTGPGIALEDQKLVFEAFKQTDSGLRQGGGTGLGMPISKNLVEAHGGKLWVESAVGTGTTFFISLPVKSRILKPMFGKMEELA